MDYQKTMSRFGFCFLVFGLALSGSACRKDTPASDQAAPTSSASAATSAAALPIVTIVGPDMDLSATELVEAYEAGKTFTGKHLLVRGSVGEIVKDEGKPITITLPKDPKKKDSASVQCTLAEDQRANVASIKQDDIVDVVGVVGRFDKNVEMAGCILNTQIEACRVVAKALGRGTCEQNPDELGARLALGTDIATIVCQSEAGFQAWNKKAAALPREERIAHLVGVEKTYCHAASDGLTPRLAVDLTLALSRVRWEKDRPVLAP